MRKADYLTLAEIIRESLARIVSGTHTRRPDLYIENIARSFAQKSSVDRGAFLRACNVPLERPQLEKPL